MRVHLRTRAHNRLRAHTSPFVINEAKQGQVPTDHSTEDHTEGIKQVVATSTTSDLLPTFKVHKPLKQGEAPINLGQGRGHLGEEAKGPEVPVQPQHDSIVGARLGHYAPAWAKASRWQKKVVSAGVTWRWNKIPILCYHGYRKSSQKETLAPLIANLVAKKAIVSAHSKKAVISHVFPVPKASGDLRLVIDLKQINECLSVPSFKMTNHRELRQLMPKGAWMVKLDIQDAYLHVPIKKRMQKFLAFKFQEETFFFQSMPFGLAPAPYIFTRLMMFPLKLLRARGVQILAYLDDLVLWARSPELLNIHLADTYTTLTQLGFLINIRKSEFIPSQNSIWLGIQWRPDRGSLQLPTTYCRKILQAVREISYSLTTSLRTLEALQGLMAFASQVLPQARPHFHKVVNHITTFPRSNRDQLFPLPQSFFPTLDWWSHWHNLRTKVPLVVPEPSVRVWTDASSTGFGAHDCRNNSISGLWERHMMDLHINVKELMTGVYCACLRQHVLRQ